VRDDFAAAVTLVPDGAAPLNRRGVLWFMSVGACTARASSRCTRRSRAAGERGLAAGRDLPAFHARALAPSCVRRGSAPRVLTGVALTVAGVVVLARA